MQDRRRFLEKVKREVLYGHDIAPPVVDLDKCKGCGQCVTVCPAGVFDLRERKAVTAHGEWCFACGHCWAVCPEGAIMQSEAAATASLQPGPGPAVPPDTLQLLFRERRSVRLFEEKPLSKEQLLQIIEAGRYTPTGANRQDINYVVVHDRGRISELRSLVERFMEKTFKAVQNKALASLFAIRMGRPTVDMLRYYALAYQALKDRKEAKTYFPLPFGSTVIIIHAQSFDLAAPFNCSVALYNNSLMAHSLGLGSCFLGFVQTSANMDKAIKSWLGIPERNQAYGAMVVGHPAVKYRRLIERKSPEIKWL